MSTDNEIKEYYMIECYLEQVLKQAEEHLTCYTSDNKEQFYKYNSYNTIKELCKLYKYYFNQSLGYKQTTDMFLNYLNKQYDYHKNDKQYDYHKNDKAVSFYGVKETVFNILKKVSMIKGIRI